MNANLIADMEKESARLKALAKNIDAVIAAYGHTEPMIARPSAVHVPPRPARHSFELDAMADYSDMTQPDICYAILKKADMQLTREQIFEQARIGGSDIPTAEHLSPVLSRDKRFKHVGKGLWEIASE